MAVAISRGARDLIDRAARPISNFLGPFPVDERGTITGLRVSTCVPDEILLAREELSLSLSLPLLRATLGSSLVWDFLRETTRRGSGVPRMPVALGRLACRRCPYEAFLIHISVILSRAVHLSRSSKRHGAKAERERRPKIGEPAEKTGSSTCLDARTSRRGTRMRAKIHGEPAGWKSQRGEAGRIVRALESGNSQQRM
jgi:hypothetical protein